MAKRFECRFAVGHNGRAYSGIWFVWTSKNKPDLFLAVKNIAGDIKASVHCAWPPHAGERRHLHIPLHASGAVATAIKNESGPTLQTWPGCPVGRDTTLEFSVNIRGRSLDKNGLAVERNTTLLPIPDENQYVRVLVFLGPATLPLTVPHHTLLGEGLLRNGKRVTLVYKTMMIDTSSPPQQHVLVPTKHYSDPNVDLTKMSSLRVALHGVHDGGHLEFWEFKASFKKVSGWRRWFRRLISWCRGVVAHIKSIPRQWRNQSLERRSTQAKGQWTPRLS